MEKHKSLITLIGGRITLPISALSSLTTMAYLTDEVHTKYPMYYTSNEWLNIQVISSYMDILASQASFVIHYFYISLLYESTCFQIGKRVLALSSLFFAKLCQHGYQSVARFYQRVHNSLYTRQIIFTPVYLYKQINLTEQDILLCVINHGQYHWTLLVSIYTFFHSNV